MPPKPIEGSPATGVRIPYDIMACLVVAHELAKSQPQAASATTGMGAAPLPDLWWEQTGLVASSPQGCVLTKPTSDGKCSLRVGDNVPVNLSPGSIAITDARRAFYIDANCQAQPLVTSNIRTYVKL